MDVAFSSVECIRRAMTISAESLDCHVDDAERREALRIDRGVIARIRAGYPDLAPNGAWCPGHLNRIQFDRSRNRMLDDNHVAQFRIALFFLLFHCTRRKTINRRLTSYALKHLAERAAREIGCSAYVSNGLFLTAAIALGFTVKPIAGTPNAWLNVSVSREARR